MPDHGSSDPLNRLFRIALVLLASAVALQWAVAILRSIWPWLAGGALLVVAGWVVVQVVRWRRSRW